MNSIGIPVAYGSFNEEEEIQLPYIVFNNTKTLYSADSDIYFYENYFNIEMYYKPKDYEIELKLREALYRIKPIIHYEQSMLNESFLLRATFSLFENKEKTQEDVKENNDGRE